MIIKSVFWDIMPNSTMKANRLFGGTCRLHLQGWRISQARNLHEVGSKQSKALVPAPCWFLAWLTLQSWGWRWHAPPKHRLTFNRLHCVISPNTELLLEIVYVLTFLCTLLQVYSYSWTHSFLMILEHCFYLPIHQIIWAHATLAILLFWHNDPFTKITGDVSL
jgi:hypothetical protein